MWVLQLITVVSVCTIFQEAGNSTLSTNRASCAAGGKVTLHVFYLWRCKEQFDHALVASKDRPDNEKCNVKSCTTTFWLGLIATDGFVDVMTTVRGRLRGPHCLCVQGVPKMSLVQQSGPSWGRFEPFLCRLQGNVGPQTP